MLISDPLAGQQRFMTWDGQVYKDGKHIDLELMQYTGLKDINGKEIYDGDIVKVVRCGCHKCIKFTPFESVVLYDGKCVRPFGSAENDTESNSENYEVIGNIYENPELIKPQT